MSAPPPEPALEVAIRRSHCDPAGIVYYPNYLDLFEDAIEEWLGADYRALALERGLGLAIVGVDCQFLAPLRMGDRLAIRLRLAELGAGSAVLALDGEAGEAMRFTARLTAACAELASRRRIPFPPELRARLAALERIEGGSA